MLTTKEAYKKAYQAIRTLERAKTERTLIEPKVKAVELAESVCEIRKALYPQIYRAAETSHLSRSIFG